MAGSYVAQLLNAATGRWATRLAVSQGTERLTYQDLAQVTSQMVSALRGSVEREGPVAVLAGNRPHTLAVHLAGHVLGRPVAHLARDSARPGLEAFLRELRPAALVFDPVDAATAKDLAAAVPCGRLLALGPDPEATDLLAETTARRPGEAFVPQSAPRDEIRTLLCTGGTTGTPKGVVHTHRMYEALLDAMAEADGAGVRRLLHGEMSHLSWYIGIPTLMAGGTLFLHEGFDADRLLKAISTDRLTHITLTPAQLVRVLEHPDLAATDLSSLRCVLYGTAPTPPQRLREALRRFGPVLQGVYGLTEAGLITSLPPADHVDGTSDVLSSVGRPAPGASVEVRDAQGRPLPHGETGHVWVTGPGMMSGYLSHDETAPQVVQDGWLHTGDLGWLDERGRLFLADRAKDIIHHSRGTHIYPRVIEEALLQHPLVREAAVFGVPDADTGCDRVHAVLTTYEPGDAQATLRTHLYNVLRQDHLVPDIIEAIDELPLTRVGKVDKQALRRRYLRQPQNP